MHYYGRMSQQPFSQQLETWLKGKSSKTIVNLINTFQEKSFAIIILVLMFIPALPIPTGGITHVFELITMLLALELIIGRTTIWLPKRWGLKPLGKTIRGKVVPLMVRRIRWLERYSRPRLGWLINHRLARPIVGLLFLVFAVAAALAPPFSGLDTLPSLGAVLIALSLILEDIVLFAAGLVAGSAGVILVVAAGGVTLNLIHRLFR